MGGTGAGKSTIAYFFARPDLLKVVDTAEGSFELVATDIIGNIKIATSAFISETRIPNFITVKGRAIVDCPGFADTEYL